MELKHIEQLYKDNISIVKNAGANTRIIIITICAVAIVNIFCAAVFHREQMKEMELIKAYVIELFQPEE